jgi:hypothetical protein
MGAKQVERGVGVGTVPSGLLSLNRGTGFALGPGGGGVWRADAGARAVTLLGGARVGYLRAAVVAAPVAFEEEAPMMCVPYLYVCLCEGRGVG